MKQPLFVLRVIYIKPYITDVYHALSDLSWTAVLVRAELCVEKRTVQYFNFFTEKPPTLRSEVHLKPNVVQYVILHS